MVKHDNGTIRSVAWLELFPWLRLVRAFRLAISARGLVFGATAFLLMTLGWGWLWAVFSQDSKEMEWLKPTVYPWVVADMAVPDKPGFAPQYPLNVGDWQLKNPMVDSWKVLTLPTRKGLTTWRGHKENIQESKEDIQESEKIGVTEHNRKQIVGLGKRDIVCLILCGLWGTAVWALFGGAICRTAAVRLAADEQVGWIASLRYALRKWPAYFAAPLLPLLGVLLAAVPIVILGWVMRVGLGLALGGLLGWPWALAAGFVMALLLLGLLFGWPLMWATISAEGTDSFDALSRSYAYVFQRPLHYLFYAAVTAVIGWLGWLLVRNFASGVIWLSYWAAGWGCGSARFSAILPASDNLSGLSAMGVALIGFWTECVKLLAVGYFFSYFWVASTAIYFQLRRDVDATETDEVFLDSDADEEPADLPAIAADAAGAPVAGPAPAQNPAEQHE